MQEKKPGEMKQIECFNCSKIRHYANKCPTRQMEKKGTEEPQKYSLATWDASTFNQLIAL
jgi:hypothetical protein